MDLFLILLLISFSVLPLYIFPLDVFISSGAAVKYTLTAFSLIHYLANLTFLGMEQLRFLLEIMLQLLATGGSKRLTILVAHTLNNYTKETL